MPSDYAGFREHRGQQHKAAVSSRVGAPSGDGKTNCGVCKCPEQPGHPLQLGRHHAIRNRVCNRGKSGAACADGDGGMTGYDWFKVPTYKPVVTESQQVAERRDRLIKLGVRDEIKRCGK